MERPSYYYYYCYCRHCCHYVAMATADEVLLLVACVCYTVCNFIISFVSQQHFTKMVTAVVT